MWVLCSIWMLAHQQPDACLDAIRHPDKETCERVEREEFLKLFEHKSARWREEMLRDQICVEVPVAISSN